MKVAALRGMRSTKSGEGDGRHDAVRRFGKLKARFVARNRDIAKRGERAAETYGAALHDADDRGSGELRKAP